MRKKDIKELFQAIRKGAAADVETLVGALPELVNATASSPPKSDDGQSPLQVALKNGRIDIANFLLDRGADVNHIEVSALNEWRAPVLHDAIRATLMTLCYGGDSDPARQVLERLLAGGADPNALDSYGNSPLTRALLDARQALDPVRPAETAALREEKVRAAFQVLLARGADVNVKGDGEDAESALEVARGWGMEHLLNVSP